MKPTNTCMMNGGLVTGRENPSTNLTAAKIAVLTSLRQNFGKAIGVASGIVIALILTHSLVFSPPAAAQRAEPLVLLQDLGRPPFANPCEMRYRESEKRLRGVIEIVSGKFLIPNQSTEPLRQYRDPASPCPTPTPSATAGPPVSPGPTLRARLGDQVQISFLNKALSRELDKDRVLFPFSPDTTPKPGKSSFGCDKSGIPNASGTILPYPGNDKFPNCFHGSSTANIHFHGTHTSPDGLGDNVLVQILADKNQPDWTSTFNRIFDSGKIPEKWLDLPADYRDKQMEMIRKYDDAQAELARRNNLLPPERLSVDNQHRIAAGEWPQYLMGAFPNFFDIPDYSSGKYKAGQAPGTHWYHAHKHGSTSLHILNGLAGALIIESNQEGGYDHFIRKSMGWTSYEGHEKIFVFQQYDSSQNLMRSTGAGPRPVLINGKLTPIFEMRPGEIQLWRLINATEGNDKGIIVAGTSETGLFKTQGKGFTFKQTAQDGVQFNKDNYLNQPFLKPNPNANGVQVPGGITLAAGNRVDLLVQAPATPGRHEFRNDNDNADLLFVVRVDGTPMPPNTPQMPSTWTEDLVGFLKDLPPPSPNDNPNFIQFQWEAGRKGGGRDPKTKFPPHFMINGKQFGEYGEVVDQCMPQDGLQDWILENYTVIAHPFHIHINPFQVIQIDKPVRNTDPTKYPTYNTYAPTKSFVWQDVVAIPPAVLSQDGKTIAPGRVRIRHKFLDFTGTFVLHCHILAHEDRGMMQLVRVVRADNYPNGCQLNIPAHH